MIGLVVIIFIPLLFFGALEVALRVAGFGYPTSFFRKYEINGRKVLVENDKFGLRFFPSRLARSPAPVVLPAEKSTNTFRIFLLGESAALGDPKPAYGFGRYLQVLLTERHPGARFEVVCVAMTAINSHAILPIARECAAQHGDLWVVYMGNNELEGPFGASGAFGRAGSNPAFVKASLAVKRTRIGQLLDAAGQRWLKRDDSLAWSGLKLFLDHQVGPDDPGRQRADGNFQRNLEGILDAGRNAGVEILLCTVASNLRDCAPYASMHPTPFPAAARAEWDRLYQEGTAAEAAGNHPMALEAYSRAAKLDARFAELQFRIGRCQQALTNIAEARKSYALALDCDALPFRTTSPLNQIIVDAAKRRAAEKVHLVDAAEILARDSTSGIPGDDLFLDHVHFNPDGNYRMARILAENTVKLLPEPITTQARGEWLSPVQCDVRLALTDWNRFLAYEGMLVRISEAPYTNQLTSAEQRQRYLQTLSDLRVQLREADRNLLRDVYEKAVTRAPEDHYVHQSYAEFLESTGDLGGAAVQWRKIQSLLPHHALAFFQAGRVFGRQSHWDEARKDLSQAIRLRPDFVDAWVELGRALVGLGREREAIARCAEALRLSPEHAAAHFQMANALAAGGNRSEAMHHLREAVRLRPADWEARYFLGVELAMQEKVKEAEAQFVEVVRLRPDYALGHLNLGVALAKQERFDEARAHFQRTLKLDPKNAAARKHLETIEALRNRPRD